MAHGAPAPQTGGGIALPALPALTAGPHQRRLDVIAVVATLRETSVLFGALIAVVILKEPLRAVRIVAALLILAGLVLIRLQ